MLLIKNASLIDMAGTYKEKRDILIDGGTFASIAPQIAAQAGYKVIDADGRLVTPGLIESHCHLGMADSAGQDINEKTGPIIRDCARLTRLISIPEISPRPSNMASPHWP